MKRVLLSLFSVILVLVTLAGLAPADPGPKLAPVPNHAPKPDPKAKVNPRAKATKPDSTQIGGGNGGWYPICDMPEDNQYPGAGAWNATHQLIINGKMVCLWHLNREIAVDDDRGWTRFYSGIDIQELAWVLGWNYSETGSEITVTSRDRMQVRIELNGQNAPWGYLSDPAGGLTNSEIYCSRPPLHVDDQWYVDIGCFTNNHSITGWHDQQAFRGRNREQHYVDREENYVNYLAWQPPTGDAPFWECDQKYEAGDVVINGHYFCFKGYDATRVLFTDPDMAADYYGLVPADQFLPLLGDDWTRVDRYTIAHGQDTIRFYANQTNRPWAIVHKANNGNPYDIEVPADGQDHAYFVNNKLYFDASILNYFDMLEYQTQTIDLVGTDANMIRYVPRIDDSSWQAPNCRDQADGWKITIHTAQVHRPLCGDFHIYTMGDGSFYVDPLEVGGSRDLVHEFGMGATPGQNGSVWLWAQSSIQGWVADSQYVNWDSRMTTVSKSAYRQNGKLLVPLDELLKMFGGQFQFRMSTKEIDITDKTVAVFGQWSEMDSCHIHGFADFSTCPAAMLHGWKVFSTWGGQFLAAALDAGVPIEGIGILDERARIIGGDKAKLTPDFTAAAIQMIGGTVDAYAAWDLIGNFGSVVSMFREAFSASAPVVEVLSAEEKDLLAMAAKYPLPQGWRPGWYYRPRRGSIHSVLYQAYLCGTGFSVADGSMSRYLTQEYVIPSVTVDLGFREFDGHSLEGGVDVFRETKSVGQNDAITRLAQEIPNFQTRANADTLKQMQGQVADIRAFLKSDHFRVRWDLETDEMYQEAEKVLSTADGYTREHVELRLTPFPEKPIVPNRHR